MSSSAAGGSIRPGHRRAQREIMSLRRRALLRMILCLAAGAVVTVALAWWCALYGHIDNGRSDFGAPGRDWPASAPSGWPQPDHFSRLAGFGISGRGANLGLGRDSKDPDFFECGISVREFGLPFRSMAVTIVHTYRYPRVFTDIWTGWYENGVKPPPALDRPGLGDRRIPLRPLWLGLAADTTLFATLAWVGSQLPSAIRRRKRRRAGRCIRCGYDLAGLSPGTPCPECANQVRDLKGREGPFS